ncbi:hypothetical protein [Tardiphaga robiniae]|uniref:Uncharacterized protein n=1 Tax=Tardiphaga robiniae TaxID=943830 RepID=A0A7G6TUI9_9BRAD|nr:hypothetical protein [Tardiphaga robiniae]QND70421.1 hypothetical protein HB776_03550 [Tardiphaga robiniae]
MRAALAIFCYLTVFAIAEMLGTGVSRMSGYAPMTLREFTQLRVPREDVDVSTMSPAQYPMAVSDELTNAFQQNGIETFAGKVAQAMRLSALRAEPTSTEAAT